MNGEGSEFEIIIIDIPDFCLDGNEPKSPRYCQNNLTVALDLKEITLQL